MSIRDEALRAFEDAKHARLTDTKARFTSLFMEWVDRMELEELEPRIYWEKLEEPKHELVFKILFMLQIDGLEFRGSYSTGHKNIVVQLEGYYGTINSLTDLGAALAPKER